MCGAYVPHIFELKGNMPRIKKESMVMFQILPEYLNKIKSGEKTAEVRRYYKEVEGKDVGLVNTETNKLELVITIGQILNLQSLNEEELELMLDEAKVSEEFRLSYPCNFMYMITGIKTIH
jgi:ASC-1-like (ASCH) protein|tara:strand:+ start:131 stop:493 length:363 start_codon:yes stop_codon:yes gene_type:complete